MKTLLFDSHTHIDMVLEKGLTNEFIENEMRNYNIAGLIQIGSDKEAIAFSKKYCDQNSDFHRFYTVGFHPSDAGKCDYNFALKFARENKKDKKFVAIGETGLDYYYQKETKKDQIIAFEKFVHLAIEQKKPLCVHTREAFLDTFSVIKEAAKEINILIHCFTGTKEEMHEYLSIGCFISFSGIVTFNKAEEIKKAALECPLDKILIESDAPFLAPMPHRGKVNHPALIKHTAEHIALIKNIDFIELCENIYKNTIDFYKLNLK
ncbi:MAG: TatD family hydrolase [Spirochaetia bacterium]|nr:TatD family hydrolase [Spirochaetia bacterium]